MTGNLFADILLEAKETDPLKAQLAKVMSDALRSSRTLWYLAQALEMDPKYSNQEELKQKVRELAALMAKRDDLMKEVIQSSKVPFSFYSGCELLPPKNTQKFSLFDPIYSIGCQFLGALPVPRCGSRQNKNSVFCDF